MYNHEDYGGVRAEQNGVVVGRVVGAKPNKISLDTGLDFNPCFQHAILRMPLLYKRNQQGNVMVLNIWVSEGDTVHSVITEKGKADRKYASPLKVPASKTRSLKAYEQIISKWNKKSGRDGWSPEEGGEGPKYFEPQLLHRWDKHKSRLRNFPLIIQPKLNGMRGVYYNEHKQLVSRKRDELPLPHLVTEMEVHSVGADGEIFKAGYPLEEIIGAARRQDELDAEGSTLRKSELEYWLFDRHDMPSAPYSERYASLFELDLSTTPHIKIVPAMIAHSHKEAEEFVKQFLRLKYEGGVARDAEAKYQRNKRVYEALKMKPVYDAEFPIVDVVYDMHAKKGKLIAFICQANAGTFKVTPAWDHDKRAAEYAFTNHAKKYIGKPMTVEYRDTTVNGLPQHAVGIRIREDV